MHNPVLGIAAMGRSLAMVGNTTAKHAMKRVHRFLGNTDVNLEVASDDLIATVVGDAPEILFTLDWTDPNT
ncbi:MAG: IS4 family transposase, partial [Firmicutes bacterium]|nr:IS4 family transposase [Bacillota bacterium]